MVPHNTAAPDGGNADFPPVPAFSSALALIDIGRWAGEGLRRRPGQHEGGAAGGVQLFVVVALHDFYVKIPAQHRRRPPHQVQEHIDPQGHVGRAEDGNAPGRLRNGLLLYRAVPRSTQNQRNAPGLSPFQQTLQGGGRGEVHQYIGLPPEPGGG